MTDHPGTRYPLCEVTISWPNDRTTVIGHMRILLRRYLRTITPDREAEHRVDMFTDEALHADTDEDLMKVIHRWVTVT